MMYFQCNVEKRPDVPPFYIKKIVDARCHGFHRLVSYSSTTLLSLTALLPSCCCSCSCGTGGGPSGKVSLNPCGTGPALQQPVSLSGFFPPRNIGNSSSSICSNNVDNADLEDTISTFSRVRFGNKGETNIQAPENTIGTFTIITFDEPSGKFGGPSEM